MYFEINLHLNVSNRSLKVDTGCLLLQHQFNYKEAV